MNGHVAAVARVFTIGKELSHELVQSVPALHENTGFTILTEDRIAWIEGARRADRYTFFACRDLEIY